MITVETKTWLPAWTRLCGVGQATYRLTDTPLVRLLRSCTETSVDDRTAERRSLQRGAFYTLVLDQSSHSVASTHVNAGRRLRDCPAAAAEWDDQPRGCRVAVLKAIISLAAVWRHRPGPRLRSAWCWFYLARKWTRRFVVVKNLKTGSDVSGVQTLF